MNVAVICTRLDSQKAGFNLILEITLIVLSIFQIQVKKDIVQGARCETHIQ